MFKGYLSKESKFITYFADIAKTNGCLQSSLLLKPGEEIKPIHHEMYFLHATWWTDPPITPSFLSRSTCQWETETWVADRNSRTISLSWKPVIFFYCQNFHPRFKDTFFSRGFVKQTMTVKIIRYKNISEIHNCKTVSENIQEVSCSVLIQSFSLWGHIINIALSSPSSPEAKEVGNLVTVWQGYWGVGINNLATLLHQLDPRL